VAWGRTIAAVRLFVCDETYAIARLDPADAGAPWLRDRLLAEDPQGVLAIVRTAAELSVLAPAHRVPEGLPGRRDLRLLEVEGPLPLHLVGVLARLSAVLAAAHVPVLAVSSHDTDFVAVPEGDLARAIAALRDAGLDLATRAPG
jgi:uncharacterized protein